MYIRMYRFPQADTVRVIYSWNDEDPETPATVKQHQTRGTVSINLLGGLQDLPPDPDDLKNFTVAADKVLPLNHTIMHAHTHTHIIMHLTHTCTHTHMHLTHTCTHTCTHASHTHMHTHMHTHTCMYLTHTCMHTYMYMHARIYNYTQL